MIPTSILSSFLPSIEARARAASAVNCHDERAQRSNLKRAEHDDGRENAPLSLRVCVIATVSHGLAD
jgi:hypothetical protein